MHSTFAFLLVSRLCQHPSRLCVSLQLNSGITSSNGRGTRTLSNQPGMGITTRVGSVR